tara:strand:- start:9833 stop:10528 length:696 start_codon:yes stop_codon:yes gene_type:complete
MKKTTTFLAALAILFTSFNASAEGEDEDRRRKGGNFGAHLNLSPIFSGIYSANVEYGFAKNMSVVLGLGFIDWSLTTTSTAGGFGGFGIPTIKEVPFRGFMVAPEFRYYFDPNRRPGLDRWFVGGYLKVRSVATSGEELTTTVLAPDPNDPNGFPIPTLTNYDVSYFGLSIGTTFGYMYAFKSGLTLGSWLGIGYFLVSSNSYSNNAAPTVDVTDLLSIDPRFGLTVGYRF